MKLEIVSHCWRYSRLLTYQLSSLLLHPPQDVNVLMTVFHTEEDRETAAVVDYFATLQSPHEVAIRPWRIPREQLLRRAIGRNLAALTTSADWVWFTDCDYVFGAGCPDALPAALEHVRGPLAYPREILINTSHELGDEVIERIGDLKLAQVEPTEYAPARLSRAIGGVQIVRGDVARTAGYLPNSRWQLPVAGYKFCRCREDRVFRKALGTRGEKITLPNLYRIRHSQCGRKSEATRL